eukprot:PLAT11708.1.p1 GENE.PLAT11708.1~~PLAT11708.1.p1  ORF type:complete len:203 (-),score=15.18 PLAT11708.1:81-668(-)
MSSTSKGETSSFDPERSHLASSSAYSRLSEDSVPLVRPIKTLPPRWVQLCCLESFWAPGRGKIMLFIYLFFAGLFFTSSYYALDQFRKGEKRLHIWTEQLAFQSILALASAGIAAEAFGADKRRIYNWVAAGIPVFLLTDVVLGSVGTLNGYLLLLGGQGKWYFYIVVVSVCLLWLPLTAILSVALCIWGVVSPS